MTMCSTVLRLLRLLLPLFVAALTLAPARAQNIRVTVVTILATDRNTRVDERIKCVAEQVKKLDASLTGFRVERVSCRSLAVGVKETFKLVEEQTATITIQRGADKDKWVSLTLKAPTLGEITYSVLCEKYLPVLTRFTTKDGERLILAVMVKPCPKGQKHEEPKKSCTQPAPPWSRLIVRSLISLG